MQFAPQSQALNTIAAHAIASEQQTLIDITADDVSKMVAYLRKARDRAIEIRDRSPAGSYMESVLSRTIDGLSLELSQLDYLLARKPGAQPGAAAKRRMRPAL